MASVETPHPSFTTECTAVVINIEGYDWNCPLHITTRFSEAEMSAQVARKTALLEAEIASLRAQLAGF